MTKHILLVDDDGLMRRSLAFNLEQAGYRTSTAANAEDALILARRDVPDLILLDFEPFYRSQRHRRFPQGLGLGLTNCSRPDRGSPGPTRRGESAWPGQSLYHLATPIVELGLRSA